MKLWSTARIGSRQSLISDNIRGGLGAGPAGTRRPKIAGPCDADRLASDVFERATEQTAACLPLRLALSPTRALPSSRRVAPHCCGGAVARCLVAVACDWLRINSIRWPFADSCSLFFSFGGKSLLPSSSPPFSFLAACSTEVGFVACFLGSVPPSVAAVSCMRACRGFSLLSLMFVCSFVGFFITPVFAPRLPFLLWLL